MTGSFETALRHSVAVLNGVPRTLHELDSVSDDVLLDLARVAAIATALAETNAALIAGEMARRSAVDLGSSGLAQRTGHRTPVELVRATTGVSVQQARRAVRVGAMLDDERRASSQARPWLISVAQAVGGGRISPAAADAIACGLGAPNEHVDAQSLARAAEGCCPRP